MDAWCLQHTGKHYDDNGCWAASGHVIPALLDTLLADPYFERNPPKSTGRDWFNLEWLQQKISGSEPPVDVQATLLQLTAHSIVAAVVDNCPDTEEIYVCGGGAHNTALMKGLADQLPGRKVEKTDLLGVAADWVEAFAFAWLAQRTLLRETGNLASVTGAKGDRILGAIYPA